MCAAQVASTIPFLVLAYSLVTTYSNLRSPSVLARFELEDYFLTMDVCMNELLEKTYVI